MKKMLFCVFVNILLTMSVYSQQQITKFIGDEQVDFQVPSGYTELLRNYQMVIDAYVESENKNLELTAHIAAIETVTKSVNDSADQVQQDITQIEKNVDIYVKTQNRPTFFFGGLAGYGFALTPDIWTNIISVGPAIAFGNKKFHIQLGLPVSFATPANQFQMSILASILFHK